MPGMDKTGPYGTGPMGKGLGPCGGGQASWGRGGGFRRGGGLGLGRISTTLSPDEEKEILEQQKGWLETRLAAITQKLQGLKKKE